MSGYGYGGYGAPPYDGTYGGPPPPQYGYPPQPGPYPPPHGGHYPPPPSGRWSPPNKGYGQGGHRQPPYNGAYGGPQQYGYPHQSGPYPPAHGGHWRPPNKGYGWYQWDRPSHCSGEYHWIHCEAGQIPHNAVHAGRDKDGGPLYAGRAYYEGDLLPAKVAPYHHHAYVPYGGREHVVHQFEVLVSHHTAWAESRDGHVPPESMVIGQTCDGENLYMGRTMHDGTLTPGKIQRSHGCLYIPYGGEEIKYREYEVLILN